MDADRRQRFLPSFPPAPVSVPSQPSLRLQRSPVRSQRSLFYEAVPRRLRPQPPLPSSSAALAPFSGLPLSVPSGPCSTRQCLVGFDLSRPCLPPQLSLPSFPCPSNSFSHPKIIVLKFVLRILILYLCPE